MLSSLTTTTSPLLCIKIIKAELVTLDEITTGLELDDELELDEELELGAELELEDEP